MNELTLNLCLQFTTRTQNQTLGNLRISDPGPLAGLCVTPGAVSNLELQAGPSVQRH